MVLMVLTTMLALLLVPASAAQLKLTTQPEDVTAAAGSTAVFKVGAQNYKAITWHFVSPDGGTDIYVRDIPTYFPGSSVEGKNSKNLKIVNVQPEMNGWRVYVDFTGGYSKKSEMATLWIEGMSHDDVITPTPAPTAEPTPVPTATPTAVPTLAPTEAPAATVTATPT